MKLYKLFLYMLVLASVLPACRQEPVPRARRAPTSRAPTEPAGVRVVFLGNSLAAGYGVDPTQSFPALVGAKASTLGWPVRVVNAGVSGETSAGGLSRIDWLLRDPVDVLFLELGANDGLRGIAPEVTKSNLKQIIDRTRARYPEAAIVLAGMQIPTNMGPSYTAAFREIYPELAHESDLELIPFLLDGVGGIPDLNQADGIHPTAEGHALVAETVWQVLRPIIESRRPGATDPPSSPARPPDA